MVYLHFPSKLTDEELMLKAKYAKLRKKKKALQAFQAPKVEPEKCNMLKRPLEPKDAKEFAKKMILAGKISVSNQSCGQKTMFKRPKGLERKLSEIRSNNLMSNSTCTSKVFSTAANPTVGNLTGNVCTPIHFQPFTPAKRETPDTDNIDRGVSEPLPKYRSISKKNNTGTLFFKEKVSVNKSGNGVGAVKRNDGPSDVATGGFSAAKPKQGHTIHVRAHNITEEACRETFGKIGNIVNVSMELERSCGFITFDRISSAEKAISEVNGSFIEDVQFHVSFARRQPPVTELINDAPASASWTALASSQSQKGSHQDKRAQVVYDETIDFNN